MHHAAATPDTPALIMAGSGETVSFAALEARANQVAHLIRANGVKAGDAVAIFCDNRREFFDFIWGAQRCGIYFACISTRLTAPEVAYILKDCGAKLVLASASLEPVASAAAEEAGVAARFMVGGASVGWADFNAALDGLPTTMIADASAGADMLYSSGTTGKPKGVKTPLVGAPVDADNPLRMMTTMLYGINPDTIYLSPAPLYHAAPLRWCMAVQRTGGTVVCMEKFEPEAFLAAVEQYRVTASQLVPTMFVKMLKLPAEARARHDLSSLQTAIHAAAPCSIPVKEQMIAWWGPIIHEYYAGTEGNGYCTLSSSEWLAHKGSVGKPLLGELRICDETGAEVPVGTTGTVYFFNGPGFEYHNDAAKTAESRHPTLDGGSTLGDVGYVDADGYLYLTDRKAFMIISGGVNIYPQEAENTLVTHPKVADVAVFGVPNEEFGEEVKAVVQPMDMADAGPELEAELIAFCRSQLAAIKCPRTIDFLEELPRHPTGKLYKRLLRDRYWTGQDSRIVA